MLRNLFLFVLALTLTASAQQPRFGGSKSGGSFSALSGANDPNGSIACDPTSTDQAKKLYYRTTTSIGWYQCTASPNTWTKFGTSSGMTNPMNAIGDLIYGAAGGAETRLPGNTATTRKFLRQTGNGTAATVPAWDTLTVADLGSGTADVNTFLRGDKSWTAIPDCSNSTTGKLLFNATTGVWSCGTDQTGGVGGGTPGGSDTQVQFNDGGAFGGDAGMTYDKTTDTLSVGAIDITGGGYTNFASQTDSTTAGDFWRNATAFKFHDGTNVRTFITDLDIPSCSDPTTSKLLWDSATKTFSCGTDQSGGGGGASFDPTDTTNVFLADDFCGGTTNSGTGLGQLGWTTVGSGSLSWDSSGSFTHPCYIKVNSGSTANNSEAITLGQGNSNRPLGGLGASANWTGVFVFQLSSTTASNLRVGFTNISNTSTNPISITSGFWLKYDGGDANYSVQTCDASTCTTGATTYTLDTGWHILKISSTTAGQITFELDGAGSQTLSTNVYTGAVTPYFGVMTTEAVTKTLYVDYFGYKVTGLSR